MNRQLEIGNKVYSISLNKEGVVSAKCTEDNVVNVTFDDRIRTYTIDGRRNCFTDFVDLTLKIDKSEIKVDDKLIVWNAKEPDKKVKAHFKEWKGDSVGVFLNGRTSFTEFGKGCSIWDSFEKYKES